ncbi:hypothetical protein OG979_41255 [Actinomadura citrea]|uniref:hypothetical protein n=1 Tax=Actinomadura TaxID=1988 RepID=UPI002E2C8CF0|nr:hypothetical protein [Actinomadura citrea]
MTSDDELLRSLLTGAPESEPQTDRILDAALRSFETFVLAPDGPIPLDDAGARDFARRYLLPIVRNTPS